MKQYLFTFLIPGFDFQCVEFDGNSMGEAYEAFEKEYPAHIGVILYNVQFLGA